jgi:hypothetical protein
MITADATDRLGIEQMGRGYSGESCGEIRVRLIAADRRCALGAAPGC